MFAPFMEVHFQMKTEKKQKPKSKQIQMSGEKNTRRKNWNRIKKKQIPQSVIMPKPSELRGCSGGFSHARASHTVRMTFEPERTQIEFQLSHQMHEHYVMCTLCNSNSLCAALLSISLPISFLSQFHSIERERSGVSEKQMWNGIN